MPAVEEVAPKVKIAGFKLVKRDAATKEVIETIEEDAHGNRKVWKKGDAENGSN